MVLSSLLLHPSGARVRCMLLLRSLVPVGSCKLLRCPLQPPSTWHASTRPFLPRRARPAAGRRAALAPGRLQRGAAAGGGARVSVVCCCFATGPCRAAVDSRPALLPWLTCSPLLPCFPPAGAWAARAAAGRCCSRWRRTCTRCRAGTRRRCACSCSCAARLCLTTSPGTPWRTACRRTPQVSWLLHCAVRATHALQDWRRITLPPSPRPASASLSTPPPLLLPSTALIDLDENRATALLVEHVDVVPPAAVVAALQIAAAAAAPEKEGEEARHRWRKRLHHYLDRLFLKDSQQGAAFAELQVGPVARGLLLRMAAALGIRPPVRAPFHPAPPPTAAALPSLHTGRAVRRARAVPPAALPHGLLLLPSGASVPGQWGLCVGGPHCASCCCCLSPCTHRPPHRCLLPCSPSPPRTHNRSASSGAWCEGWCTCSGAWGLPKRRCA